MTLKFRDAIPEDAAMLLVLVRRAYRGEESRQGWTTEADLLSDERIDLPGMVRKITAPDSLVLIADGAAGPMVACCELARRPGGIAYFGMFAVDPLQQAGGMGRLVLAEAERVAQARWDAHTMEMTVIGQRTELIAWYERRGYRVTGEHRAFPMNELIGGQALRDDLYFEVLSKSLT